MQITKLTSITLLLTLALPVGCNEDKASATAVPGSADASAQGDDAVAGASSDEDEAEAVAAEGDDMATAEADGEGAAAEASVDEAEETDEE